MRRRTLLALCCSGVAGLAGCRSAADDDQSSSGTRQPSETSASGSGGETGPTPSEVSVEYEVGTGDVPDGLSHVELGVAAAPEEARYDYELVSTRVEPANSGKRREQSSSSR